MENIVLHQAIKRKNMKTVNNFFAAGFAAASLLMTGAHASEPEFYRAPSLPDWAPFSSAVTVGETIYVSGHLGRDPQTNELVAGGAGPQTRQTLENMQVTLDAVGASLSDVVKCTVFLDDMEDFTVMNEAYVAAFTGPKPARSTIGADGLALGAAVEIECIAVHPAGSAKKVK